MPPALLTFPFLLFLLCASLSSPILADVLINEDHVGRLRIATQNTSSPILLNGKDFFRLLADNTSHVEDVIQAECLESIEIDGSGSLSINVRNTTRPIVINGIDIFAVLLQQPSGNTSFTAESNNINTTTLHIDDYGSLIISTKNKTAPVVVNDVDLMQMVCAQLVCPAGHYRVGCSGADGGICTAFRVCTRREYEAVAPTATTDRICAELGDGIEIIPIALPTVGSWMTSITAPNGVSYSLPFNHSSIMMFDPVSETINYTSIPVDTVNNAYWSGVLAENGLIYGVPFSATSVLIFDPLDNSVDTTSITVPDTNFKWISGVQADNGLIFCVPSSATSVLIIDPSTNNVDMTSMPLPAGSSKFGQAIKAPNGLIYATPQNANYMLIIYPVQKLIVTTSIPTRTGTLKWVSALSVGNIIYCMPYSTADILAVDTTDNSVTYISLNGYPENNKWISSALLSDGRIVSVPYYADAVLIFDPATGTVDTMSLAGYAPSTFKWTSAHLYGNVVFGLPGNTASILKLDFNTN
eukprot:m.189698 g.189698  ORF g.189698 m.189698 type:complete len:526 (+) comp16747_c0_seq11:98-1675(+)